MSSHPLARVGILLFAVGIPLCAAEEIPPSEIRVAIEKSLPLLETAALGASDHNRCFTCHNHGVPIVTFIEAQSRGFKIDPKNLADFVSHSAAHLERGKATYTEGKGQGGQVDTAGYALWALDAAAYPPDEITAAVATYFLKKDAATPFWTATSSRPPSQGTKVTSTFLALRALQSYGTEDQQDAILARQKTVTDWLIKTEPASSEERVFRLLALTLASPDKSPIDSAAADLLSHQQVDGGWAQLPDTEPDAYATGSALYALTRFAHLTPDSAPYQKALRFLLDTQKDDGSWHVSTRARPIQKYYESGFPHGKDQFISCAATAWSTLALLQSLPVSDLQK